MGGGLPRGESGRYGVPPWGAAHTRQTLTSNKAKLTGSNGGGDLWTAANKRADTAKQWFTWGGGGGRKCPKDRKWNKNRKLSRTESVLEKDEFSSAFFFSISCINLNNN